ncbi:MAG: YraN family protein [Bacteroidales bacterium]|nr:MAG: YraN family protein [Bacteroidales bacterium]
MKRDDDLYQQKNLGKLGEDLAVNFLHEKGYSILHRNWHYGHKEIDIIAMDNQMLVIVEVKTRATSFWEEPKEAVRRRKQKRIIDAADAYVQSLSINAEVRFDIVSVVINGKSPVIEHIEDAFYPTL